MFSYKALSLKQPWGNFIREGLKTIETRKWNTEFRGDLVICASKSIDVHALKFFKEDLFNHFNHEIKADPVGVTLCLAELYDCRKMKLEDEEAAMCEVYMRAHSFLLRNIRKLKPYPVKGELGIFDLRIPININELMIGDNNEQNKILEQL
jgi:hypothetical protein